MADILAAVDAIQDYLAEGSLDQGVVYDACRARLIEIGEAIKHIDPDLLAAVPTVRWRAIARMRDRLAHHYFDTDHAVVAYVVHEELALLRAGVVALAGNVTTTDLAERSGRRRDLEAPGIASG